MPSPDTNHFTPFGARVSAPPQIRLKGPSPMAQHIARRIHMMTLLAAVLSLAGAACMLTAYLVALDRQIEMAEGV